MTVMKKKDMDWKQYLRLLGESYTKISDIERSEFAGYLLRRDLESTSNPAVLFDTIFSPDRYCIADYMADTLIAESPDSIEDLLNAVKNLIIDYYEEEIDMLVEEETKIVEEERMQEKISQLPEKEPNMDDFSDLMDH